MSRTIETTTHRKLTKREQQLKDKARAEEIIRVYAELKRDREETRERLEEKLRPFKEDYEKKISVFAPEYSEKLQALDTSIESAKEELIRIGGKKDKKGNLENKNLFTDNNWHFEDADGHYLHIKVETEVKTGSNFSLPKFVRKFGEYVDVKYKIAQLKKVFSDGDDRKKFTDMDFDLQNMETVEVKQKASKG